MNSDSELSDFSEISNVNFHQENNWEILSDDSNFSHISVPLPEPDDVKSISNDENNNDTNNTNKICQNTKNNNLKISKESIPKKISKKPENYISTIEEDNTINNDNINEPSFVPSYTDIQRQLEISRNTINQLQEQLNNLTIERDQVIDEKNELERENINQQLRIRNLEESNIHLATQNSRLRYLTNKTHKKITKKRLEIELKKSNYSGDHKKSRHHKRSVPAKLKFRRSKTTHRTIYTSCRKW